jgi:hypothetical protein
MGNALEAAQGIVKKSIKRHMFGQGEERRRNVRRRQGRG